MENLEILIIEDNSEHLKDAELEMNKKASLGAPIKVDYATNYAEAEHLSNLKKYHGIISDVFFPYDNQTSQGKIKGWNSHAASICLKAIVLARPGFCYGNKIRQEITRWVEGESMHPTGIVAAEKLARNKSIPIVFCTDSYHHGDNAQPVSDYSISIKTDYIDNINNGKKDWKSAYTRLLYQIAARAEGYKSSWDVNQSEILESVKKFHPDEGDNN
jgi:hypothetical protein